MFAKSRALVIVSVESHSKYTAIPQSLENSRGVGTSLFVIPKFFKIASLSNALEVVKTKI